MQAGESPRVQPSDYPLPQDLPELRAKFASSSGSGLSEELSTQLALEIVLHEIAEQACLATGATGAAIVLERDGEMVCRASAGPSAPELGSRLDAALGLSWECIRTREVQRCEDALIDPRADGEASRQLGVRSVVVFPLVREEKILGIFEAFSSRVAAFGERDERTLEALAGRILKNLERAAKPFVTPAEEISAASSDDIADPEFGGLVPAAGSRRAMDIVTWALGAVVLISVVWVGVRMVQHFGPRTVGRQSDPKTRSGSAQVSKSAQGSAADAHSLQEASAAAASVPAGASTAARASRRSGGISVPEGSLLVYENGKEVFRMPPAPGPAEGAGESGIQPASSLENDVQGETVMKLSPEVAEGSLIHRVAPVYPDQARQEQIEGPVVLDVRISTEGAVQELKLVSGQAPLALSAMDAVKRWKFKPRKVNGHPVEMQTRITVNFRLPR